MGIVECRVDWVVLNHASFVLLEQLSKRQFEVLAVAEGDGERIGLVLTVSGIPRA